MRGDPVVGLLLLLRILIRIDAPVGSQGRDPDASGPPTQEPELRLHMLGVKVKGRMCRLSANERTSSARGEPDLIDVVGWVEFTRHLINELSIKQLDLLSVADDPPNQLAPPGAVAQLDASDVGIGGLPHLDGCDASQAHGGEGHSTTGSNGDGVGVVLMGCWRESQSESQQSVSESEL